jgi:hypothetical protein
MDSVTDTLAGGFPHSEISGSKFARNSPELFAACYVLHRLLAPRHPPNALLALDLLLFPSRVFCFRPEDPPVHEDRYVVYRPCFPRRKQDRSAFAHSAKLLIGVRCSRINSPIRYARRPPVRSAFRLNKETSSRLPSGIIHTLFTMSKIEEHSGDAAMHTCLHR